MSIHRMKIPYKSPNPNSGVTSYEVCDNAIILEYKAGRYRYVYNAIKPGSQHVAAMAKLAAEGQGLTTYVSRHIQGNYARKLPITQGDAQATASTPKPATPQP